MKRGYMNWEKTLLPESVLKTRRSELSDYARKNGCVAAVVYGDVYSADELIEYTNYGPYWCNTAAIITADGQYRLVTGHNARVNAWICEMTGVEETQITPAGMKVPAKTASVMKELFPNGGKVLLCGKYTLNEGAKALEAEGFTVTFAHGLSESLLCKRDDGYKNTVKEGHKLFDNALAELFAKMDLKRTIRSICADIEYALRSCGAMDVFLYVSKNGKEFSLPSDDVCDKWNIYLNIQYLGEWSVLAFPIGSDCEDMYKAMKESVSCGCGKSDRYETIIKSRVVADQISSINDNPMTLQDGQIISISCFDRNDGRYAEKMFILNNGEVQPLGKF